MATDKSFVEYVLEQLSDLEDIGCRPMMGEYVLYYRGKVAGGIYDNRLLIKPVQAAVDFMPAPCFELPYQGGKEMLLVEQIDDKAFVTELFKAMYDQLEFPKKRKPKKS